MRRSANGVLVLVLGILSWVGAGIITAIPAWIIGNNSMLAIDRGEADPSERGIVQAGRVLGMIHCILAIAALGCFLLFLLFTVGLGLFAAGTSR